MSMNDPIGDLLTRIRNAQMRAQGQGLDAGLEAARQRARSAASAKATSAATPASSIRRGRSELEIELKYFDGEPVIREIERVSKPGRRVYVVGQGPAARQQRSWHLDPVDAEGRDGRPRSARRERRRRSSLHGVLRKDRAMSRVGKKAGRDPVGRHRDASKGRPSR